MAAFIGRSLTEMGAALAAVSDSQHSPGADSIDFKALVQAKQLSPTKWEFPCSRELYPKYSQGLDTPSYTVTDLCKLSSSEERGERKKKEQAFAK